MGDTEGGQHDTGPRRRHLKHDRRGPYGRHRGRPARHGATARVGSATGGRCTNNGIGPCDDRKLRIIVLVIIAISRFNNSQYKRGTRGLWHVGPIRLLVQRPPCSVWGRSDRHVVVGTWAVCLKQGYSTCAETKMGLIMPIAIDTVGRLLPIGASCIRPRYDSANVPLILPHNDLSRSLLTVIHSGTIHWP